MGFQKYTCHEIQPLTKRQSQFRLTDVTVDEVSAVVNPANQDARIVLMKNHDFAPGGGVVALAKAAAAGVASKRFTICDGCPAPDACRQGATCRTETVAASPGASLVETAKGLAAAASRRRAR
jgi:hypothetical protein